MTWEYLIGSEKDFEGAPHWCTHVSKSDGMLAWEECSVTTNGKRYQWVDRGWVRIYENAQENKLNIVAQRRKRESKQWDGVGLPLVGCECEALIPYLDETKHQWRKVKVISHGDEFNAPNEFIVVDLENTHPYWTDAVRPLRTKEQTEREDEVKNMVYFLEDAPLISWEDIAGRIFDAGYRKIK